MKTAAKLCSVILSVFLTMALISCGGTSDPSNPVNNGNGGGAQNTPPAVDAEATINLTITTGDITFTSVEDDDTLTLTPAAGYTDYTWKLNGHALDESCSVDENNVLTFEKIFAVNGDGLYSFTLKAKKNGITYTANAEFYLDDIESGNVTGNWPGCETVTYKIRNSKMVVSGTGALPDIGIWDSLAISGFGNVTELIIEDGITRIGAYCFQKSNKLTEVKGCENITEIGEYAFNKCKSLKTIPSFNNVTYAGGRTFYECEALTSVNGFNNMEYIMHSMFEGCSALTSIKGFNSVKAVWDDPFKECSALVEIKGFNSVRAVDFNFKDCPLLKTVEGFNTALNIGDETFKGCSSLVSIKGFSNLLIIYPNAFDGCTSFERFEFGGTEEVWKDEDFFIYTAGNGALYDKDGNLKFTVISNNN